MTEVTVNADGRLSDADVLTAKHAIETDGFVVLRNAVDLDHIAKLREKMFADAEYLLNRTDQPFNWTRGNLQQKPPVIAEYLFRDVLVNEAVIQVTHSILGHGLKSAFYEGNTAVKSESRQPVHADMGQLWPNLTVAHPAYALVVNVPTVDMSAENGSTEIWPGTHLDTSVAIQDGEIEVSAERLAERRATHPPLQPTVAAGSILIRDMRMWHAGMPNRTETPRPMIAMIHYVGWFPTGQVLMPAGTEDIFTHPTLRTEAKFVDGEIDYLNSVGGYKAEEATA
ncbi:MAG: phytanoyl-CoA dioxygenase family protein [Fimbriimonadaceae bacterium]|nr:phytanoyl-CoA dioxygenase family protein [Fimbriimonadaceae bacterium]